MPRDRYSMDHTHQNTQGHQRYRLLVLGCGHVGKTCLIKRYLNNTFSERYRETVEDIYPRDFHICGSVLPLDIYDTNFYYPDMRRVSIASADAFMLVFAVDDVNSFKSATELVQEIAERRPNDFDRLPLVLVGNRADADDKKIFPQTVHMWLNHLTYTKRVIPYYEASAKTAYNVVEIFKCLLDQSGFPNNIRIPADIDRRRRMLQQNRAATIVASSSPSPSLPPRQKPGPPRRQFSTTTVRCLSAGRYSRDSTDDEDEDKRETIPTNRIDIASEKSIIPPITADRVEAAEKPIRSIHEERISRFARAMSMKKEKLAPGMIVTPAMIGPHTAINGNDEVDRERSKRGTLTRHGSLMKKSQPPRLSLKMKRSTIDEPDESDCKIS